MSRRNTNGPLRSSFNVAECCKTVACLKRWAENTAIGFGLIVSMMLAAIALIFAVLAFTAAGRLFVWWAQTAGK